MTTKSNKKSEQHRLVGKVKDAHNLKGENYILIFAKEATWFKKIKSVLLKKDESDKGIEFIVERAKPHKDGLIVKFQNIEDRTQAEKLKSLLFYVPQKIFESAKGEDIYLAEIEDFEVFNGDDFVGVIVGFQNYGAHDLLVVEDDDNKQYEIPFVKEFIEDIDFESAQIIMNLPDGLLNINDQD